MRPLTSSLLAAANKFLGAYVVHIVHTMCSFYAMWLASFEISVFVCPEVSHFFGRAVDRGHSCCLQIQVLDQVKRALIDDRSQTAEDCIRWSRLLFQVFEFH